MIFYIVLDQPDRPLAKTPESIAKLYTDKDIERMRSLPQFSNWTIVPVEAPWNDIEWARAGGRRQGGEGMSPYPTGTAMGTMRVPKDITYQVQQYAVWLAANQ